MDLKKITLEEKTEYLQNRDNWGTAHPRKMPRPTYWPFFFAMGISFMVWGLLTGWVIGISGAVLTAFTLTGWITELRHEEGRRSRKKEN